MKATNPSYRRKLPTLLLYVDDIESIERVAQAGGFKIKIDVPGFQLTAAAELLEFHADEITNAIINCENDDHSSLTIFLTPKDAGLWTHSADSKVLGLGERITQILTPRERTLMKWLIRFFPLPVLIFIAPMATGLLDEDRTVIAGALLTLVGGVWCAFLGIYASRHYTTLILKRRKDAPNFWIRNKDQLILHILNTAISALIAYLLTTRISCTSTLPPPGAAPTSQPSTQSTTLSS